MAQRLKSTFESSLLARRVSSLQCLGPSLHIAVRYGLTSAKNHTRLKFAVYSILFINPDLSHVA